MNFVVEFSHTHLLSAARFGSSTVVAAFLQLLHDQDANIRAVAALSLSHCGYKSAQMEVALIASLNDEDRIVRESCCISLGNMGCTAATATLADLWYDHSLNTLPKLLSEVIARWSSSGVMR